MPIVQDQGWWFLKTMARKSRDACGKSQRDVGDEIYRSIDTISDWERGKTDIPLSMVETYARACGMDDELVMYMQKVAVARKNGQPIEADMRYNALFIALAEEHASDIFKWDALLIPGPLQMKGYHYTVLRLAENATDEALDRGWIFKTKRREALQARTDEPTIRYLIGEAALHILCQTSESTYDEQLGYLRDCAERPGWDIRILREPVRTNQGNFEIYRGNNALSCPTFVYVEGHDSSWCIDEPERFEGYDTFRERKWKIATRIEDY